MPNWVNPTLLKAIEPLAAASLENYGKSQIMRILKSGEMKMDTCKRIIWLSNEVVVSLGPLLSRIGKNMWLKSRNRLKPDRKMMIYGIQELILINLMMNLNINWTHYPPTAAMLAIELIIDDYDREYYVQVSEIVPIIVFLYQLL